MYAALTGRLTGSLTRLTHRAGRPGQSSAGPSTPGLWCAQEPRRPPQLGDDLTHSGIRQPFVHRRDPILVALTAFPG